MNARLSCLKRPPRKRWQWPIDASLHVNAKQSVVCQGKIMQSAIVASRCTAPFVFVLLDIFHIMAQVHTHHSVNSASVRLDFQKSSSKAFASYLIDLFIALPKIIANGGFSIIIWLFRATSKAIVDKSIHSEAQLELKTCGFNLKSKFCQKAMPIRLGSTSLQFPGKPCTETFIDLHNL